MNVSRTDVRLARAGFTLVELLVSMALIVFIMSILAGAFSTGGKMFSDMKAIGDLNEQLRGVNTLLRLDLAAPHFDATGTLRLGSASGPWQTNGTAPNDIRPPANGFLRIYQEGRPTTHPSTPPPYLEPPTHTTTRTMLHFTSARLRRYPHEVFTTQVPLGYPTLTQGTDAARALRYQPLAASNLDRLFRSEYAEIAWWLKDTGETTDGTTTGPRLFALCRRQRILWWQNQAAVVQSTGATGPIPPTDPAQPTAWVDRAEVAEVSVSDRRVVTSGTPYVVNQRQDVTVPPFRFGARAATAADPNLAGQPADTVNVPANVYPPGRVEDVLAHNVLSWDIRILLEGETAFRDLGAPLVQAFANVPEIVGGVKTGRGVPSNNPAYPAAGPFCFDTWTSRDVGGPLNYQQAWQVPGTTATIPLFCNAAGTVIRIRAIQATIRIWDPKSQMTRQVTMVQDM